MFLKIGHRLTVDLNNLERTRFLYQVLCHDTHPWSYLQYRKIRTSIYSVGYCLGDVQVGQKVLTEILLRSYLFHGDKITIFFSFIQKKADRIHIRSTFTMLSLQKSFRFYFISRFMSLLTFTASATHTATTNVTINNAVIIFSFL